MNKYKDFEGSEKKTRTEPHPDYPKNLKCAENFIKRVWAKKLPGMNMCIRDSNTLEKALLTISYTPPRSQIEGRWANSIFLHENHMLVKEEVAKVWSIYLRIVAKPALNALESIIIENMTTGTA